MLLSVLSPAKNIQTPPTVDIKASKPAFLSQAEELMTILKEKSPADLGDLMKLSENLSNLNYERNQKWKKSHTEKSAQIAAFSFNGDVYQGLDALSLNKEELSRLQKGTLLLSGLYGFLKPLDLMKPYRLEMGTKLQNAKGGNLYHFWKEILGVEIQKIIKKNKVDALVNLASNEYFKSVNTKDIQVPIYTPVFKDFSKGNYKTISFFAKKARGLMVRFMVQNDVKTIEELKSFNTAGYYFKEFDEKKKELIFYRDQQ
jgi:cytoplasmic iron level regulating protein YaaA (DUF328/UPF0246 family)